MPSFVVNTNVSQTTIDKGFLKELSSTIAEVLKKPESVSTYYLVVLWAIMGIKFKHLLCYFSHKLRNITIMSTHSVHVSDVLQNALSFRTRQLLAQIINKGNNEE